MSLYDASEETGTPTTPATSRRLLYPKSTGWFGKDAAGNETQLLDIGGVHAASSKTTPVDADELPLADSASSFSLKKLTWANLKTTLGSTFAALAGSASQAFSATTAAAGTNTTQVATTAYADRLTAGTLAGAFTTLSASGSAAIGGTFSSSPVSAGKIVEVGFPGNGYYSYAQNNAFIVLNCYYNSGWKYASSGTGACRTDLSGNETLTIGFAPTNAGAAGAAATITDVAAFSSTGLAVTGLVSPSAHNTYDLGTTALRWKDLWLQSGAFNGSDARLKTAIAPLTANEINAAKQLSKEIGTYQWLESVQKKGDAARHHVGFTVQRAIEIMQANGCDPFSYGFIGYDKWDDVFVEHAEILPVAAVEAKEAVLDADGNEIEPAVAAVEAIEGKAAWTEHKTVAGDAYSFRYDQLNMFVAAGLEARLSALESR